ncbi:MAG TPA: hypothetical protein VFN92_13860 [Solirubrobacterales bacterium]|nr:hypothetical protein [Solirubrobacterales bacterium]
MRTLCSAGEAGCPSIEAVRGGHLVIDVPDLEAEIMTDHPETELLRS